MPTQNSILIRLFENYLKNNSELGQNILTQPIPYLAKIHNTNQVTNPLFRSHRPLQVRNFILRWDDRYNWLYTNEKELLTEICFRNALLKARACFKYFWLRDSYTNSVFERIYLFHSKILKKKHILVLRFHIGYILKSIPR